jgi:hypothetical protein
MGNKVYVAGVGFECEARVIPWTEQPYFDARNRRCHYKTTKCGPDGLPFSNKSNINKAASRMAYRPQLRRYRDDPPLSAVQSIVRKFVVHHDGVSSAATCFHVLHNERGLSCHFLIDNNGDIYQTLDLAFMGFHAGIFNADSIGVELCNRGDALRWPGYYAARGMEREVAPCRIHRHTYLSYDFTPEQYTAMGHLARTLTRALPKLPIEYPQSAPGEPLWGVMEPRAAREFAGYVGHYHLTSAKWDPGPFDFKKFCTEARGALCFPVLWPSAPSQLIRPVVPSDQEQLRIAASELHDNNESGGAGSFPVGPFGSSRLWHGGAHLDGVLKERVFAPFPGRIVAARQGADTSAGSGNFVLLRHELAVGTYAIEFFSLYYHLFYEKDADADTPTWMDGDAWQATKQPSAVVLLDEPIEAGQVIGRIGNAGPAGVRKPQIHIAIFATTEVMEQLKADVWSVYDGSSSGRFCDVADINDLIDSNRDGALTQSELAAFYTGDARREIVRFFVTLNVSEWHAKPDWLDALKLANDHDDLSDDELEVLVEDQIIPTLWWDQRVADHCDLSDDGVVYHYNPIAFVKYVNERLFEADVEDDDGPRVEDAREAPADVTDDGEGADAAGMYDKQAVDGEPPRKDLDLAELRDGYDSKYW